MSRVISICLYFFVPWINDVGVFSGGSGVGSSSEGSSSVRPLPVRSPKPRRFNWAAHPRLRQVVVQLVANWRKGFSRESQPVKSDKAAFVVNPESISFCDEGVVTFITVLVIGAL